jgi:hypothetical protein
MADETPVRAPLPTEPLECRQMAEDGTRSDGERLRWALLAIAGELHTIRRSLTRK